MAIFTTEDLGKGLAKAKKHKYCDQARAFCIAIYYTGAYSVELLALKPHNCRRIGNIIYIDLGGCRGMLHRTIPLLLKRKYVTELWNYISSIPPGINIFNDLASRMVRSHTDKHGNTRRYIIITQNVSHMIKTFFGVRPKFFIDNRAASLVANGATPTELKQFKGAKSFQNIWKHFEIGESISEKTAKKIK